MKTPYSARTKEQALEINRGNKALLKPYTAIMADIILHGTPTEGRNGWTVGKFGTSFVIQADRPTLLVSKQTSYKVAKTEMDWFLGGVQRVQDLRDQGVTIWDKWELPDGSIGKAYGYQWRNFNDQGIDQWAMLIRNIATLDLSAKRRLIMTAWNPAQLDKMALPPCHMSMQANWEKQSQGVYVVDLIMQQRSADVFLGVPYNILGYGYILKKLCTECNKLANELGIEASFKPGWLRINLGDYHLYGIEKGVPGSHVEAVEAYMDHVTSSEEWDRPDFSQEVSYGPELELVKGPGFYSGPKIAAEVSA